jgi:2-(1,2-epoxy-1,2-dihydrophenyl)acetyl-CoA isomerase
VAITIERSDAVSWLRLDKPDVLNALTPDEFSQVADALTELEADESCRVIVITGTGRAFCAGADLSSGPSGQHVITVMNRSAAAVRTLHHLRKPTVAAVNGVAAGAGAALALGCDLVIAARSAGFAELFVKRGLVPDFGTTWLLPRLIGRQQAARLLLLGDTIAADAAHDLGLVSEVVDDADLVGAATDVAQRLAAGPPLALALTKQLLATSLGHSFDQQVDAEINAVAVNAQSPDSTEGITAFLERRPPVFTGR